MAARLSCPGDFALAQEESLQREVREEAKRLAALGLAVPMLRWDTEGSDGREAPLMRTDAGVWVGDGAEVGSSNV